MVGKTILRQGDVVLIPREKIPADAKGVGYGIHIHGESGNTHRLDNVFVFESDEVQGQIIVVQQDTVMTHEEHTPLVVPAGVYEVRQMRTWSPQGTRRGD